MKKNSDDESKFVKVLETSSLTDVALIKSALDAAKIRYYIQGDNMIMVRPLDAAALMVDERDVKKAVGLLKPFKFNYNLVVWD